MTLSERWWGAGERVVLVHGDRPSGGYSWLPQAELCSSYRLSASDRRGFGENACLAPTGCLADAADVVRLVRPGAHVAGHSRGAVVALLAAAAAPERVRSLTLLEPPLFQVAWGRSAAARALADRLGSIVGSGSTVLDHEFFDRLAAASGAPPGRLRDRERARSAVAAVRGDVPPWRLDPSAWAGASAVERIVLVSGAWHDGYTSACEALAASLGGEHVSVDCGHHDVHWAAGANRLFRDVWSGADAPVATPVRRRETCR